MGGLAPGWAEPGLYFNPRGGNWLKPGRKSKRNMNKLKFLEKYGKIFSFITEHFQIFCRLRPQPQIC